MNDASVLSGLQELREGGAPAAALPMEIQMLRQLEGTRERSVEELAHALTRVEPPAVSSLVSVPAASLARKKPLQEKKFLKKGQVVALRLCGDAVLE